uniref:Histone-lysine N-methyltransferase PRDM9-like n=1 Tax=Geotrypetes seraphini TaxID=260995 RepID=A0A6P8PRC7_GEOSA|nr:histone-lysine N-methyltransferase PRDM9-like [Geotrypetes seraphini]
MLQRSLIPTEDVKVELADTSDRQSTCKDQVYEENQECSKDASLGRGLHAHVMDNPVEMGTHCRAFYTTPCGLAVGPSGSQRGGLGVWCTLAAIPQGVLFGPFEGDLGGVDQLSVFYHSMVKAQSLHCTGSLNESFSNWMMFVNCAEREEAQNLALFLLEGRIYYRACRAIYPAEELLVWHQDSTCEKLKEESHPQKQSQILKDPPVSHNRETGVWEALSCQEYHDTTDAETNGALSAIKSEFSVCEEKLHRKHPALGFQESVADGRAELATESLHVLHCGQLVNRTPPSPLSNPAVYRPPRPPSTLKTSATELPLYKKPTRFVLGKRFRCDYCGQLFSRRVQLRNHLCTHNGEKHNVYKICGRGFFTKTNLNGHVQIHARSRSHACSLCGKSFQHGAHLCSHTGEKSYTCDHCDVCFEDGFMLEKHRLSVSECGKLKFSDTLKKDPEFQHTSGSPDAWKPLPRKEERNLPDAKSAVLQDVTHNSQFGTNEHERSVEWEVFASNPHPPHKIKLPSSSPRLTSATKIVAHNELRKNPRRNVIHRAVSDASRTHSCELCGKTFSRKHFLTQHLRTHTGEKPYACLVCGKSFSAKSNLTEHVKIHTGERPFTCSLCSKSFHRSTHLRAHLRCHSGERPYQCQGCSRTFTRRSALKKHRMSLSACCKTASSTRKSPEGIAPAQDGAYKDSGSSADHSVLEAETYGTGPPSQPSHFQQNYHLISQNGNYINGADLKMT